MDPPAWCFYLILMTTVLNFLPDRKYEKYLRLFTGMVFILLVFGPLGGSYRAGGTHGQGLWPDHLQNDVKLLQREIADADRDPDEAAGGQVPAGGGNGSYDHGGECRSGMQTGRGSGGGGSGASGLRFSAGGEADRGDPRKREPGPLEGDTEAFRGQGAETWSREENGREAGLEQRRRANREIGNLKTRIGRVLWSGRRTDPDRSGG